MANCLGSGTSVRSIVFRGVTCSAEGKILAFYTVKNGNSDKKVSKSKNSPALRSGARLRGILASIYKKFSRT